MHSTNRDKILFIVPLPPPVHGASLRNQSLVDSSFLNRLFNIKVIPMHFASDVKDIGTFRWKKIFLTLSVSLQIITQLVYFRPQLVYFNIAVYGFALYRDAFFILVLKLFRQNILLHIRTQGITAQLNSNFKTRLFKFIFKNTNVICMSEFLSRDIKEVYEKKPILVNDGIDVIKRKIVVKQNNEVPDILFLSNFTETKGIIDLINALDILNKRNINFEATLVGKPYELSIEYLNQELISLGLKDKVQIVGPKYDDEKYEIFEASDIFVFPTYFEAFPGVVLEAMQFGLPVISTYEGAIPEMVDDDVTGILVKQRDVKSLADKIEFLLNNPVLRKEMGQKGREKFFRKYTIEVYEKEMGRVFSLIIR